MTALLDLREEVRSSEPVLLGPAALWIAPAAVRSVPFRAILESDIIDDSDRTAIGLRRTGGPAERLARRRLYRRLVVAQHVGCEPAAVRLLATCQRCGSTSHGPPRVQSPTGLFISTSAADGVDVVAVSQAAVGVDVERASRLSSFSASIADTTIPVWALVEAAYVPDKDPVKTWTAIEAITKGMATGLTTSLVELEAQIHQWEVMWSRVDFDLTLAIAVRSETARVGDSGPVAVGRATAVAGGHREGDVDGRHGAATSPTSRR